MLAPSLPCEDFAGRSLTGRLWQAREVDERHAAVLARQYGLPDALARILAGRGVTPDEADSFLNPSLKASLPDPAHLLDMEAGAARLAAAAIGGERIAIFGDYDVDGATSSALLVRYLRALGCDPLVYIPDRMKEGYGPNAAALLRLGELGATLVLTVDCGTLAFGPLEAAHQAGLDVIVVDHHIGEARRPLACAVINPNRLDETSPHRQLAAVGVAFLLCVATNRALRLAGWFQTRREPDLRQWLDIVALGTICDVVPLTGINRALVAQGLKIMAGRGNPGIRTLLDLAGCDEKPGVYHAGFVLGPRINAGGRVGRSDLGVRLLTEDDPEEARRLAGELDRHNTERKAIEAMVLEEALRLAEACDAACPVLVIASAGWHHGVIGIVAGRLKERFGKPVAVIALENGVGKASARSVPGMDFGAAVIAAREAGLLVAGGGHAMAAGFTIEEGAIAAFTEFLAARAHAADGSETTRRLVFDSILSIGGATAEFAGNLERLGPFGQHNPSVRLVVRRVVNLRPEPAGDSHVKTLFIDSLSSVRLSGIAFRCIGTKLGEALLASRGRTVDVAGQLRLSTWNGRQNVSLMVEDIAGG